MKNLQKGFTLMELLIVIGVLGILAAGLLAAIDPFEQLKKARDTNNRNATIELLSSFTRYYANHGQFPWNMTTPPAGCSGLATAGILNGVLNVQDPSLQTCLTNSVIVDGELKDTYVQGVGKTNIYLVSSSSSKITTCFAPEGKSAKSDPATKYSYTAGASSGVPGTISVVSGSTATCPGGDNCLQCFQ